MPGEELLTAELEVSKERRSLRLSLKDAQGQTRASREFTSDIWDAVLHVAPDGYSVAVTYGEGMGEYAGHVFRAFTVGHGTLEELCHRSRLPASSRHVLSAPAVSWEGGSIHVSWPPGSRALDDNPSLTETVQVPPTRGSRVVQFNVSHDS